MRSARQHLAVAGCGLLLAVTVQSAAAEVRLIDAIRNRDAAAVRTLVKQRAEINVADRDGTTPLHWAVHFDDAATIDLLLRAGAKVNVADDTGVTALYLACTNRNAQLVQKLLAAGANPNATLLNGETVLMNCARTGDGAAVKALVTAGANLDAKETAHDQTALMWAAAEAHADAVRVLIEAGAEISARSRTYSQLVTSQQTQRTGREELNYTVLRGGSTPLLFAARSGDVASVRLLLAAGAHPDEALPTGITALTVAAHSGHEAAAIFFVEHGADVNNDAIGYTALHAAVLKSELDLVKSLLAHGANPDAKITKGTPIRRNSTDFNLPGTLIGATPYLLAAKFAEPDIMRALVARGADPTIAMTDGTTAAMFAAGIGAVAGSNRRGTMIVDGGKPDDQRQVIGALKAAIDLGADLNAANQAGDTALHGAAAIGNDEAVRLLVAHGAEINAKNQRGFTPLALASGAAQRKGPILSAVSDLPREYPTTIDLLRKLGARD